MTENDINFKSFLGNVESNIDGQPQQTTISNEMLATLLAQCNQQKNQAPVYRPTVPQQMQQVPNPVKKVQFQGQIGGQNQLVTAPIQPVTAPVQPAVTQIQSVAAAVPLVGAAVTVTATPGYFNLMGFEISKRTLYIAIGLILLAVGYYLWKRSTDNKEVLDKKKKRRGQTKSQDGSENNEKEEEYKE